MNQSLGLEKRACLGGIAAAGILLTHWLAYLLVVPDAHERSLALQAAGHRYLAVVAALFVAAAVMGLSGMMLGALRHPTISLRRHSGFGFMVIAQVAGFGLLESIERFAVGGSGALLELATEPAFLVGLLLQVLVAALIVRTVHALVSVAVAISGRVGRAVRSATPITNRSSQRSRVPADPRRGAAGLRGPPLLT